MELYNRYYRQKDSGFNEVTRYCYLQKNSSGNQKEVCQMGMLAETPKDLTRVCHGFFERTKCFLVHDKNPDSSKVCGINSFSEKCFIKPKDSCIIRNEVKNEDLGNVSTGN